jgi:hypothetical protein
MAAVDSSEPLSLRERFSQPDPAPPPPDPLSREAILGALGAQYQRQAERLTIAYAHIARHLDLAFAARARGDLPESRRLLCLASDIECEVTGDTVSLSDLCEAWEVDEELDR